MSDEVADVRERLARIEAKLDAALAAGTDHENRIRRLERAVWLAAGAGMTSGVLGSIASQVLTN